MIRYFKPPVVGDWESDERASTVFYGVWLITFGTVMVGLARTLDPIGLASLHPARAPLALTAPVLAAVCLEMNRRGATRSAAILFSGGYIALAFIRSLQLGGLSAPAFGMLPVMTLFAGLTLGRRAGAVTALACGALTLLLILIGRQGGPAPPPASLLVQSISVCFYVGAALFLVHIALSRTGRALQEARSVLNSRLAAERRLALALETAEIGSFVGRLYDDHMTFDAQAFKMFGLSPATDPLNLRRLAREMVLAEDRPKLVAATESLRNGATNFRVEVRVADPDGWRHIEVAATRTVDENGQAIQVGALTDLTHRRRAEADRAVFESKLRSAEQARAMGVLAGGIAHDFNNILGAIQGFAQLLQDDLPEGSPDHGFARRITDATNRGKAVVEQILSSVRQGAQDAVVADVCVLTSELKPLVQSLVGKNVDLKVDAEPCPLWARVRSGQFTQILTNLCKNSSDALNGRKGGVVIKVQTLEPAQRAEFLRDIRFGLAQSTGHVDPDTEYALIQVADDAGGIPPERLRRIFEPFYTTKAEGRGTGLGLAVVQSAVEGHGGVCVVQSVVGAGTRFSILLPIAPPPEPAAHAASEDTSRKAHWGRVLVVDDEADMTEVLAKGLARRGFDVVAHNNPRTALVAFEHNPASWRMIVTDGMMAGLRGSDLARRARLVRPDIPIVLYSGFDDASQVAATDLKLFDLRLSKPMDLDDMARQLAAL